MTVQPQDLILILTVFLQGALSFFSPCVLPVVPLYLGYLAAGAKEKSGRRRRILINTLFFVLGISFAFFLLGLGFSAVGRFFSGNRALFARLGGILVILLGVYQLGIFGSSTALSQERRLPLRIDRLAMGPLPALLLGFVFSFAWTPCVGPALTGVLLLASSASNTAAGFGLIGVYTLGFVLPFLAVGLFTDRLLALFQRHQKAMRITVRAGGVLLILIGVMMFTGWMNGITGYLSSFGGTGTANSSVSSSTVVSGEVEKKEENSATSEGSASQSAADNLPDAPDFTLTDQFGNTHTLSDYKGKVVFLNFWATWCGPCQKEMPEIQELYEDHGGNTEDLIVLAVANPRSEEYSGADVTQPEIEQFLSENGYTYPVVMDLTGEVFADYGISAFPTTFMITREGKVLGYLPGQMSREIMDEIVTAAFESTDG